MSSWFLIFSALILWGFSTQSSAGSVRNCDSNQTQIINTLDSMVSDRLRTLLSQMPEFELASIKETFIDPENRSYTEGSPTNSQYSQYVRSVYGVLSKMSAASQRGVNFQCTNDRTDRHCQGGEVIAYVLYGPSGQSYPMIYLCTGFFRFPTNTPSMAETVFHELSHYAANTEDYALDWWMPKNLNLARGAMDAYHYGQFMNRDARQLLRTSIWSFLWPKKPK
jgi:hypothetical protein